MLLACLLLLVLVAWMREESIRSDPRYERDQGRCCACCSEA